VHAACDHVSRLFAEQELAFSLEAKPISRTVEIQGVEIIRLNSNLVFISSSRIKDTLIYEVEIIHCSSSSSSSSSSVYICMLISSYW
jgi:hypothetical protein